MKKKKKNFADKWNRMSETVKIAHFFHRDIINFLFFNRAYERALNEIDV